MILAHNLLVLRSVVCSFHIAMFPKAQVPISLQAMFLAHLHPMLLRTMLVDKVNVPHVLFQPESLASLVVSPTTTPMGALKRLLVVQFLHPRKMPNHLVLDAVV